MLMALGAGLVLGLARPVLDTGLWLVLAGVTLVGVMLTGLVHHWLIGPLETLTRQTERLGKNPEADQLRRLPVSRGDELGRLARAVHAVGLTAYRERQEALRLRRTLDDRIEQATRRQTSHLEQIAMREALTGLANRRCLDQRLPALMAEARGGGNSLICLMMDLDNFKAVNDTMGHAAGDELLKLVGQLLRGSVRDTDLAVRLGGDEFAVVLPGATVRRGESLVESLRHLLRQQMTMTMPETPGVNLSAGLAMLRETGGDDAATLIGQADGRLYRAKHSGKGCTATPGGAAACKGTPSPGMDASSSYGRAEQTGIDAAGPSTDRDKKSCQPPREGGEH